MAEKQSPQPPVTAEEFDLVCDMIEILIAFGGLQPRPLMGTPAEARIFAFRDMRNRRKGQ